MYGGTSSSVAHAQYISCCFFFLAGSVLKIHPYFSFFLFVMLSVFFVFVLYVFFFLFGFVFVASY